MQVIKLLKFLGQLKTREKGFFDLAMASIFGEALFPEQFDVDTDDVDFVNFKKMFGNDIFDILYSCALEFFFSNDYMLSSTKSWNVIDVFLSKKHSSLEAEEIEYYKALRNSYMSIYEVLDIEKDKSITLRDIIDENAAPIVISEKKATHWLVKWDLIGGRIVKMQDANILAGGVLKLTRDESDKAKAEIVMISNTMRMYGFIKDSAQELMTKKMWAKEIIHQWFHANIKQSQPRILCNIDGHKLAFHTLEYDLKKPQKEVIQILDSLGELGSYDVEGYKHTWVWVNDKKAKNPKGKNKQKDEDVLFTETYLNNIEDGKSYSIFAEIKLHKKKLIVDINSKERADILDNYIKLYLPDHVKRLF